MGKQLKLLNVTLPEVKISKEIREKHKRKWKRQNIKTAKKTEEICKNK